MCINVEGALKEGPRALSPSYMQTDQLSCSRTEFRPVHSDMIRHNMAANLFGARSLPGNMQAKNRSFRSAGSLMKATYHWNLSQSMIGSLNVLTVIFLASNNLNY